MPNDLLAERQARTPRDLLASRRSTELPELFPGSNAMSSFTNNVVQGATFGMADEISAGAAAPFRAGWDAVQGKGFDLGRAYSEGVSDIRAEQRAMDDAHPVASVAGNITGAVGGGLGLARNGLTLMRGAQPTVMSMAGRGTLEGALYGGAHGLGAGEGLEGKVNQTGLGILLGVGIGAVGGAAAPYIARGGTTVSQKLAQVMGRGQPATPADNMSRPAFEALSRSLQADDTLGHTGATNIGRAGPDGMLADAGPNAQSLLDTAIQRSGGASRRAADAVQTRAARASDEISTALDTALGSNRQQITSPGVFRTETALRKGTSAARSDAYDAAYATPIDYVGGAGQEIRSMLNRIPPDVINTANRMMRMEGKGSNQILARMANGDEISTFMQNGGSAVIPTDGSIIYQRLPDVRQLDYITRALNQAARSGEGQGALGGQTDIGRIYSKLASDLRSAAKTAVPEYRIALETAAGPIQRIQALELGRDILRPNVSRDVVAEQLYGLSGPEKAFVRQGIRSTIDEAVANVKAVVSDPNIDARQAVKMWRDLSSPAAREKISLAIGDEAVSQKLFDVLGQSGQSLLLRASIATNSRTFARQATDEAVGDFLERGPVNQLLQGKPVNATQEAVQRLTGRTPQGISSAKDKVYSELADALVGPRGPAAVDMLSALASRAGRSNPNAPLVPGLSAQMAQSLIGSRGNNY